MTRVYFPYCSMAPSVLTAINDLGGPPVVYHPSTEPPSAKMQQWEHDGRVVLQRASATDNQRLQVLLKEHRSWAQRHAGDRLSQAAVHLQQLADALSPHDRFVSQLKTDIRGLVQNGQTPARETRTSIGSLLAARLFLSLALELDVQYDQLAVDVERHDRLERHLLENLHGAFMAPDDQPAVTPPLRQSDAKGFMMAERLKAWFSLFVCEPPVLADNRPVLWVTDHRSVIENLQNQIADMTQLIPLIRLPGGDIEATQRAEWQAALSVELNRLAQRASADPQAADLALPPLPLAAHSPVITIFVAVGHPPAEFCERMAGRTSPELAESQWGRSPNTLVGLLERC